MARLLGSVVTANLLIGLLGLVWIFWRSRDPAVIDLAALGTGATDPALVEALRADAAGAATTWWLIVMAAAALAALAWLLIAWRRQPGTPDQARSATVSWWLLLLAPLLVSFVAGFLVLGNPAVAQSWRLALIGVGAAAVPLAYYLSTAFGVKIAMSPSVPLALLFRR